MLAQVHFLQTLQPGELDRYLSEGWFRMGQTIFTTNFLNFKRQIYSAVWLRMALERCGESKAFQKLSRINAAFMVEICEATITPAHEDLFARYRKEVPFEASPSLHHLLFGKSAHNVYRTYAVNIYDMDKLIASGFFDTDNVSAAGITSYYEPSYKKYSLGKYLIYLKADYCRKAGLQYFYPGYFAPGYPAFDYKLKIYPKAIQYFQLSSGQWLDIDNFSSEDNPIAVMQGRLTALKMLLAQANIRSKVVTYDYYDANLVHDLSHIELFDFPVFLDYFDVTGTLMNSLITYDARDQRYQWVAVKSIWASGEPNENDDHYTAHLLKTDQILFASQIPEEMVEVILTAIKSNVLKQKLG